MVMVVIVGLRQSFIKLQDLEKCFKRQIKLQINNLQWINVVPYYITAALPLLSLYRYCSSLSLLLLLTPMQSVDCGGGLVSYKASTAVGQSFCGVLYCS